ncbi:MAG: ExbD/TolR family protein [Alphaproteobacteria bacterium]
MLKQRNKVKGDISLTPLIDVVFILLIFFMITMSLYKVKAIKFDLPKTSAVSQNKNDKITKTIIVRPSYVAIGKKRIDADKDVLAYIKANTNKKTNWGLQPDKYISVERYLGLWKYLLDNGVVANIILPKKKGAK